MGFSFIKDVYPEDFQNQLPPTSAKNTEKYTMPVAFGDPYFNKPSNNDNIRHKLNSLEQKLDQFMNNKVEHFSQEKTSVVSQKKRIENVLLFVMTFIFIGQVMENSFSK